MWSAENDTNFNIDQSKCKEIKQNFKPQYLQGAGTLINFMGKYQLYMLQFHFMEYTL